MKRFFFVQLKLNDGSTMTIKVIHKYKLIN